MSTPLSIATVIEKNKVAGSVPFLVCLEITIRDNNSLFVETVRVVNNPEDVIVQGVEFGKGAFSLSIKQESGSQADVSLSMHDYTKTVITKMNLYGGGIGFKVKMLVVNSAQLEQPPEIVEFFEVVSATAQGFSATLGLGAENFLVKQVPGRTQLRDFCSWGFKDHNCGYTGSQQTCDRSLNGANGCALKSNTRNFGGYPAIIAKSSSYV